MKTYEQTAEAVLARVRLYEQSSVRRRNRFLMTAVPVCAVVFIVGAFLLADLTGITIDISPKRTYTAEPIPVNTATETTVPPVTTTPDTTTAVPVTEQAPTFVYDPGNTVDGLPVIDPTFERGAGGPGSIDFIPDNGIKLTGTERLPVYRNISYHDGAGISVKLDEAELTAITEDIAGKLGLLITSTETERFGDIVGYDRDYPAEMLDLIYYMKADCDDGTFIYTEGYGNWWINFNYDDGCELPEGIKQVTEENMEQLMTALLSEYSALLGYEDPGWYLSDHYEYESDGQHHYNYVFTVYEKSDDPAENAVNATLNNCDISIYGDDSECRLYCIGSFTTEGEWAEHLGDYPIITEKQALENLLAGKFISSMSRSYLNEHPIDSGSIVGTYITYVSGENRDFYQPYYVFILPAEILPDEWHNERFYVPAVQEKYLFEYYTEY